MAADLVAVENRLWAVANQLWANTGLRPADFSEPVLGLIFLRYADKRFAEVREALIAKGFDEMNSKPTHSKPRVSSTCRTDVPPLLSSTMIWSPIPNQKEIGYEEAFFRRKDHRFPA